MKCYDFLSWFLWFTKAYNLRSKGNQEKTINRYRVDKLEIIGQVASYYKYNPDRIITRKIVISVFKGYYPDFKEMNCN